MPEFHKQYKFKDTNTVVESIDQFINIRIGAHLIKNTGEEYIKTADHVYDKIDRVFVTPEDLEGKYAILDGSNIFIHPQFLTVEPTDPYHITNKQYVDELVADSAVDLSGYARLDAKNVWEEIQICNAEPIDRTHMVNKGYVDDRVNEIVFDTTSLAKLNSPNTFTAPITVTVPPTEPGHLVNKEYVDESRSQIVDNISGFVRADLPNEFTATQTFTQPVLVPEPKLETEAATKGYVDTVIGRFEGDFSDYAKLSENNVFLTGQTIRGDIDCSAVIIDGARFSMFALDLDASQKVAGITSEPYQSDSPYIGLLHGATSTPYAVTNAHAPINKLDNNIITGKWFSDSPFITDVINKIHVVMSGGVIPNDNAASLKKQVDARGVLNVTAENILRVTPLITGLTHVTVADPSLPILVRNDLALTTVINGQNCGEITAKGHNTVVVRDTQSSVINIINAKCILEGVTCDSINVTSGELIVSGLVTGNINAVNSRVFLDGEVTGQINCSRGSHAQIYANQQYDIILTNYASIDDKDSPQENIRGDGTETNINRENRKTATFIESSLGFNIGFTNSDIKLYACRIATMGDEETVTFIDYDGIPHSGITRDDFITMQSEACEKYLDLQ